MCLVAYIVKKGWPFVATFNYIIMRFYESGNVAYLYDRYIVIPFYSSLKAFICLYIGLIKKWYTEVRNSFILQHKVKKAIFRPKLHVLAISDLQTAFYILIMGQVYALLVLFIECIYYRRKFVTKSQKSTLENNK